VSSSLMECVIFFNSFGLFMDYICKFYVCQHHFTDIFIFFINLCIYCYKSVFIVIAIIFNSF
jgi:hypothetical protein